MSDVRDTMKRSQMRKDDGSEEIDQACEGVGPEGRTWNV